jgi:hypothetical protein
MISETAPGADLLSSEKVANSTAEIKGMPKAVN